MAYQPLAPRTTTATLDQSGRNAGNWTNSFTGDVINQRVPIFECYHIAVQNAPGAASATIYINQWFYSFTAPGSGGGTEWDPAQPMLLQTGYDVYVFWNAAASGTAPVVTMWFRFDNEMSVNQLARGGGR